MDLKQQQEIFWEKNQALLSWINGTLNPTLTSLGLFPVRQTNLKYTFLPGYYKWFADNGYLTFKPEIYNSYANLVFWYLELKVSEIKNQNISNKIANELNIYKKHSGFNILSAFGDAWNWFTGAITLGFIFYMIQLARK